MPHVNPRYAGMLTLVVDGVLIAHALLAFTKMRWVTGLLELVVAAVLLWNWRQARRGNDVR